MQPYHGGLSNAKLLALCKDTILCIPAEILHTRPWHRGFKGFRDILVLKGKIAKVCNHKREEVSALAVLCRTEREKKDIEVEHQKLDSVVLKPDAERLLPAPPLRPSYFFAIPNTFAF